MSIADAVQECWGWTRQWMGLDPPEDPLLKELRRRSRIKVWEMQVREAMERRSHDERMRCEQLHQTILARAQKGHRVRSQLVQIRRGRSAILIQRVFQCWSVTRHEAAIKIQHAFRRSSQAGTTQQSIISRLDVRDAATSERPLNVSVSASVERRLTRIQAVLRGAAERAVYRRKRSACLRTQRSWRHVCALDFLGLKLLRQAPKGPVLQHSVALKLKTPKSQIPTLHYQNQLVCRVPECIGPWLTSTPDPTGKGFRVLGFGV